MRKNWFKHEKFIMRKYGLTPQPKSGSGELFKEDGESEKLLAQLKSTQGKSISFKKSDILKLIKNASIAHKKPVFFVDFVSGNEDLVLVAMRPFDIIEIAEEFQKLKFK